MTNVKLSDAELALAADAELLLTKNRIIEKVYQLFGELSIEFREIAMETGLPGDHLQQTPKISRGENYLGLPWVILDYPRNFGTADIFAIRTMFWWGKCFSQFLVLKGVYLNAGIVEAIAGNSSRNEWYICVGNDPWQHHFQEDNMVKIENITPHEILATVAETGFLKMGIQTPVLNWAAVEELMLENYRKFLALYNCGNRKD